MLYRFLVLYLFKGCYARTEMWFIRRMLRISWTEKKPNVNVLREGNVQRSLLKTMMKRQMEFLGHVCRRRGLEFLSFTGKVEGKCDRGKQRITFLESLCNSATGGQSKGLNFLKLSDDRDLERYDRQCLFQIWHLMMMMMMMMQGLYIKQITTELFEHQGSNRLGCLWRWKS